MSELLNKAIAAYAVSEVTDRDGKMALARELNDYGILSKRQIASLVRVVPNDLGDLEKRDKRGGKFNPNSLEALEAAAAAPTDSEEWRQSVYAAYTSGTGAKMIATLLDAKVDTIWYWIRALRGDGDE